VASVTLTVAAGGDFGSQLRQLARAIEEVAMSVPDKVSTGASSVLTIDNAASGAALCSVQVTAGRYAGSAVKV